MAYNFLDKTGLALVWEKIKNLASTKVDKVDGKGLSTNDYTSDEKTKLAGIATGAQVNTLEGVQVNGTTVTPTNKIANIAVPTATSDLTNDSGFITTSDIPEGAAASTTTPLMDGTAAVGTELAFARGDHIHPSDTTKVDKVNGKGLSTEDYTTAEKTKLSGIAESANNYVLPAATTSALGGIIVGSNLSISEGVLSADAQVVTVDSSLSSSSENPVQNKVINSALGNKAPLASPALTGTPTAPTATAGTNTTQIATTAFVTSAISAAQVGAAMFQGTVSANTTISSADYKKGMYWVVATAGTYVGQTCEVGDMIFAIADKSTSYSADDFSVVQNNLDLVAITSSEINTICV